MNKTARVCLITGASSGIGLAAAHELLRAGHTVYAAARRADRMESLRAAGGHVLTVDVRREDDLERAVRTILDEQKRIDVLVNNAGIGLHASVEDAPLGRARELFEVNLFAPGRLIQLVLPSMRERRSGTIVNVSSIGGELALPLGAWYYASKHALEAFSDTLRQEVGRFGIDVVLVQPGIIKTEFEKWSSSEEMLELSGNGAYRDVAEAMATRSKKIFTDESAASDPSVVAKTLRKAIESPAPKTRYPTGYLAKLLLTLNRILPDKVFDKIVTQDAR